MDGAYFDVSVSLYDGRRNFHVVRPSSVENPKDSSVIFVTEEYADKWRNLEGVTDCLVIWSENAQVPEIIKERNAVITASDPRREYARFFYDNGITYNQDNSDYEVVGGACIGKGALIGRECTVFPGTYIGPDVRIGDRCYIASGARLVGRVRIGDDAVIRENAVIGADGLTRMRDEDGRVMTIPQFGGVRIGDNVQIGANTVISKGAIDDTVIGSGCRIDNSCFISHNVRMGRDGIVVGETIMFGSSSLGERGFISGNCTVRDGCRVGNDAFVGMGSNVLDDVPDGGVVKGNPAR